jgi:heat shock protein HslJ
MNNFLTHNILITSPGRNVLGRDHKYVKNLFLLLLLALNGCKNDQAIDPDKNYTTGLADKSSIYAKWQLSAYESGQKIPYDVILEFKTEKNEKGRNILSGKSSINFYQADFSIVNTKININNLVMTEIAGNASATAFEKDYLLRLAEVSSFDLSGENLTLSSTKQKMIFKLNN